MAVLLASCGLSATDAPASAMVRGLPDVPVDSTLEAVSKTNPDADAAAALDQCVRPGDIDKVVGMAHIPARDVHRFTLTNGKEPELETDALVWAIQLKGGIHSSFGVMLDPLCVVLRGEPIQFVPYGLVGEPFAVPEGFVEAVAALPSLAP